MVDQTLETTVAVIVTKLDEIKTQIDRLGEDHEARIRKLEAWMYAVPASLLAAITSLIIAYLNSTGK